jgi:hypothetical protein
MTAANNSRIKRNRLQLLIILLTPLLVVASSTLLYVSGWLLPKETSNHGYLLAPVLAITDLGLPEIPITQERQWQLIQYSPDCARDCDERMLEQRQMHLALGKYQPRIHRVLLTNKTDLETLSQNFPNLSLLQAQVSTALIARIPAPHLQDNPVFVVDPFGNVMLYFTSEHDYKAQMSDLKKLLKNSTIG